MKTQAETLVRKATPTSHDRRLSHPGYDTDPLLFALRASYEMFASNVELATSFAALFTTPKQQRIVQLASETIIAQSSPANTFFGNAAAREKAVATGGRSVLQGLRNFATDVRHNKGRPLLSDNSSFMVGVNLAVTPGVVVHREELFELIRYAPTTPQVSTVPTLIIPPPINRPYVADLAKNRSLVQHAVAAGNTVFLLSWVNPTKEMADTSFDDYITRGVLAALAVVPAPKVNLLGICLGGTLSTMAAAHDAAVGAGRVNSLTLVVTLTDFSGDTGALGAMLDDRSVAKVRKMTARQGVLSGEQMGSGFTALKPMDLIWAPASWRWLEGEEAPAIDLLAWNADGTRLAARMHGEYLETCYLQNRLYAGAMVVGGVRLDMTQVMVDTYVVAGKSDHIVPWVTSLVGAGRLGGRKRLVVANGGHLGAIVAPLSARSAFRTGPDTCTDAASWEAESLSHAGTWWDDWTAWLADRSGKQVTPSKLGKGLCPAPGTYVFG